MIHQFFSSFLEVRSFFAALQAVRHSLQCAVHGGVRGQSLLKIEIYNRARKPVFKKTVFLKPV
jgi:hypothetical protein